MWLSTSQKAPEARAYKSAELVSELSLALHDFILLRTGDIRYRSVCHICMYNLHSLTQLLQVQGGPLAGHQTHGAGRCQDISQSRDGADTAQAHREDCALSPEPGLEFLFQHGRPIRSQQPHWSTNQRGDGGIGAGRAAAPQHRGQGQLSPAAGQPPVPAQEPGHDGDQH